MPNVYDQILGKLSPEDAKVIRERQNRSDSAVTRLKVETQRVKDKGNIPNRKLTLSRPSLAVTEVVKDSRKQAHDVQVVEILNSQQYSQLRPLLAPLIEVSIKALQGTEITSVRPIMQTDPDGKRTDKPMIGDDGKPIVIPSSLQSIQKFYSNLLNSDSFKKLLDETHQQISKLAADEPGNPLFKRYAPRNLNSDDGVSKTNTAHKGKSR